MICALRWILVLKPWTTSETCGSLVELEKHGAKCCGGDFLIFFPSLGWF